MYWFSALFAIAAYVCSRGKDGELIGFISSFSLLGLIYCALATYKFRTVSETQLFGHFIAFELAVICAMLINSKLDEMGTMLYILMPAFIGGIVLITFFAVFIRQNIK